MFASMPMTSIIRITPNAISGAEQRLDLKAIVHRDRSAKATVYLWVFVYRTPKRSDRSRDMER